MKQDPQIDTLKNEIRELADSIQSQVPQAAEAAITGNEVAAESVISHARNWDRHKIKIKEKCLEILPFETPMDNNLHPVSALAMIAQELSQIGVLTKKVAHQTGVIASLGLPATARDISLLAKLAATSCAKAINAVVSQNAEEAHATKEDYATLTMVHRRLATRFDAALGQPGIPIKALLAACLVASNLSQIGGHCNRIADMSLGQHDGEPVCLTATL
ncbi:MAG: PhoU domain-containing protein [bacterium]